MTVTSRGPAMLSYLFALFSGDATLGGPIVNGAQTGPVAVYDGPPTTLLDPSLKLYVGLTNPDDTTGQAAYDSIQSWASLGRRARNEDLTIHCCAEAWSGDDSIPVSRTACAVITAAVEMLMQADISQFGGNVLYPNPGFTNLAAPQQNSGGGLVRQAFDLQFMCRIGG
jgi:hypothetical protein